MLALYNNASDGGRSMIIDWVAASGVAKTAAAGQAQLLVNVGQVRETAPTDAALAIKKANGYGQGTNDTVVRTIVGGTALPSTTGIAGELDPVRPGRRLPGRRSDPRPRALGAGRRPHRRPARRYFAMHVLADVVGSTFQASSAGTSASSSSGNTGRYGKP
jgi:hypothetical protein